MKATKLLGISEVFELIAGFIERKIEKDQRIKSEIESDYDIKSKEITFIIKILN